MVMLWIIIDQMGSLNFGEHFHLIFHSIKKVVFNLISDWLFEKSNNLWVIFVCLISSIWPDHCRSTWLYSWNLNFWSISICRMQVYLLLRESFLYRLLQTIRVTRISSSSAKLNIDVISLRCWISHWNLNLN
jgi:hypothetical protein